MGTFPFDKEALEGLFEDARKQLYESTKKVLEEAKVEIIGFERRSHDADEHSESKSAGG
jgi:hypothetical protein